MRSRGIGSGGPGVLLSTLLSLSACDSVSTPMTVVETDSAGVRIIEHRELPDSPSGGWRISERPVLTLGEVAGEEPFLFSRVRGVARLSDGRIAVADGLTNEIRVFSASGEHVFTTGGKGQGPGEFSTIGALFRAPRDSLAVTNLFDRTISFFGPNGEWARTVRLDAPEGASAHWAEQVFGNGWLLIHGWQEFVSGIREEGYQRAGVTYSVYSGSGDPLAFLGTYSGSELQITESNGRLSASPIPMGRAVEAVVSGESVFIAETDRFQILRYGPGGELKAILRAGVSPIPFSDEIRSQWIEHTLGRFDDPERVRRLRDQYETFLWPDSLPVFADLKGDGNGNLWVRRFRPDYTPGPDLWWVFDSGGHFLASVETPEAFEVHVIDDGFLVTLTRDELDVERIVVHQIER